MKAIFFDLETTDRRAIGQILNYSFVLVDEKLNYLSELNGLIRLSRLQLPSPGALLANRINILEHQRLAVDAEKAAMGRIHDFISQASGSAGEKVALIGFNSSRFDVEHLRTGMIRNGLNPYFFGKLLHRDLFLAAKKLAVSHAEFPRAPRENGKDNKIISLGLENLCQRLGLLCGRQQHESRGDVMLTIDLARVFRDKFGLDILPWEAYEVSALHTREGPAVLQWALNPSRSVASAERAGKTPLCLLDFDGRSALWINLDEFKAGKGRESIGWFGLHKGQFISGGTIDDPAYRELALKARQEFKDINVSNFFGRSACDIEADIYRLDMGDIRRLGRAIWEGDTGALAGSDSRDLRILWTRYRLANTPVLSPAEEVTLRQYAVHRYGGGMQISKNPERTAKRGDSPLHQTWLELQVEFDEAYAKGTPEDRSILEALRQYYRESDIMRVAGRELDRVISLPQNVEIPAARPADRSTPLAP